MCRYCEEQVCARRQKWLWPFIQDFCSLLRSKCRTSKNIAQRQVFGVEKTKTLCWRRHPAPRDLLLSANEVAGTLWKPLAELAQPVGLRSGRTLKMQHVSNVGIDVL